MSNELMEKKPDGIISESEMRMITSVVQQLLQPVMENMAKALERIAQSEQLISMRVSDLEKQVRLQKPVSKSQEKYISDAIRRRAKELLDGKGYAEDRKAVNRLSGMIRKSVLERYGVGSLREAPAYDYETSLEQVQRWNDLLALREVAKEARERAEKNRSVDT